MDETRSGYTSRVQIHPEAEWPKRSLTIHKLNLSDRGTYSCETLHDRTQAKLTVERMSALLLSFSLCAVVSISLR